MKSMTAASIYSCELPTEENLLKHLAERPMTDISEAEQQRSGWICFPGTESLVSKIGEDWLGFALQFDEKIIPAYNIQQEVAKRIAQAEEFTGEIPCIDDLRRIKDDAFAALCKRALPKTRTILGFYHTTEHRLIINTSTPRLSDIFTGQLLHSVGSIKATTIYISGITNGLTERMRKHVLGEAHAFASLLPATKCCLRRKDEEGEEKITLQLASMASDEILSLIDQGFKVHTLGFDDGGFSFVLTEKFKFSSISDYGYEAPEESDVSEDTATSHLALRLNTLLFQLNEVIKALCIIFEYKPESEAESEAESPEQKNTQTTH